MPLVPTRGQGQGCHWEDPVATADVADWERVEIGPTERGCSVADRGGSMVEAGGTPGGGAPVGANAPPAPPPGFGLTTATALIVGSIIGVGIFNLPTSLAGYGPISLVSMGLTTIGAVALAILFASLSRRLPADGGPYAYARVAYGNAVGFANAWSYWITPWAGNAAIAVGWVLYVEVFINKGHAKGWTILLVLVGLWVPALINLSGVRNMGA